MTAGSQSFLLFTGMLSLLLFLELACYFCLFRTLLTIKKDAPRPLGRICLFSLCIQETFTKRILCAQLVLVL